MVGKPHRVGLVGLAQARQFIKLFDSHPGFEVTALCDIDREVLDRVGEQAGIAQRFTDYDRFVESDVDVVELSTPIPVHGQQAIKAMKNGKHVLCQYIAANDPDEAEELLAAAQASRKKYMFIETDCYERANRTLMALARKEVFGELIAGTGDYMHDCTTLAYHHDGTLTWRGEMWRANQGGVVLAVHTAMPLLELFGERVASICAAGSGAHTLRELRWNDFIVGLARLASGRMLELRHSTVAHRGVRCGYCLQGTKGCFEYDRAVVLRGTEVMVPGRLPHYAWQPLAELVAEYGIEDVAGDSMGHSSAWGLCVQDFVSAIVDDTTPRMGLHDALHVTAIGWAAEESMRTGRLVDVIRFD